MIRCSHRHFLNAMFASAATAAAATLGHLDAQIPSAGPTAYVPLTVEVFYRANGVKQSVTATMVCVGSASDPQAYGKWLSNSSGQVVFDSVPFGGSVYVTAQGKQIFSLGGDVQGKRLNYVAKAAGLVLPIELAVSSQPGPTCSTPIGQEPAPIPSKTLPSPVTAVPTIESPLLASPNPALVQSPFTLFTHGGSSPYIAVTGVPTEFALVSAGGTTQAWVPVTTVGYDRIAAVAVNPPTSAGVYVIGLKVRNALGESAVRTIEVPVLDLRPCVLTLTQRTSPTSTTTTTTSVSIARTKSHGWAGDGRWVVMFDNDGPHPITFQYFRAASSDGSSVGNVNEMTLQPGVYSSSTAPLRNITAASCP